MYWFELISAYPTRYMCYIFELPRSRSRDMYRHALNMRSGIFLHKLRIIEYKFTTWRFFFLKMDVVERLSHVLLGSAGALYLRLGGKGNRHL